MTPLPQRIRKIFRLSPVLRSFYRIQKEVGRRRRIHYCILVFVMMSVGLLESISTAWIALYASMLSDPSSFYESKIYSFISRFFNLSIGDDIATLLTLGSVIMAGLIAAKNGVRGVSRYMTGHYASSVSVLFGKRLVSKFLNRPYDWYLRQSSSEMQQTVEWRVHISEFLLNLLQALSDVIIILFLFATLIIYNTEVAGPIIGVLTFFAVVIYIFIRKVLDRISRQLKELTQKSFHELRSIILAFKNIRIFGMEDFSYQRYRNPLEQGIRLESLRAFWVGAPMLILESLGFIALAFSIFAMLHFTGSSANEALGLLALMGVTAWRVLPALNRFLGSQSRIRINIPFIESFLEMFYSNDDRRSIQDGGKIIVDEFRTLQFDDVDYQYSGSDVLALNHCSFQIHRGEKIGVIGVSGSGKTTLVDLLTGLLKPTRGRVLLNGIDLTDCSLNSWKQRLSYLPQKVHLLSGSLDENIAFGLREEDIDRNRVLKASEQAAIGGLVQDMNLRSGVLEDISDDGKNLSGGQVQRIGVARMFYRDTDFWVVDEGTASLDRDNEAVILNNIFSDDLRTVIFITHRLETLRHCQRILVIQDGRIVEDGPGEELLDDILATDLVSDD